MSEAFFREIDAAWAPRPVLRLYVIGCTALKLQTSYGRSTKDADVLDLQPLDGDDAFISRFRAATDPFLGDARSADLPTIVRNLHYVEESMFGRSERTPIELPDWLDR